MNATTSRKIRWLLPLLVLLPRAAHGQADPDSIKRRNDCRLAAQVIETGNPAPHRDWAWQMIAFCEPGMRVQAYRTAIHTVRTSTDPVLLARAIRPVAGFRDGELFRNVLQLAGDRGASAAARAMAFVALAAIADPRAAPDYEAFRSGIDQRGIPRRTCSRQRAEPLEPSPGVTPMPVDSLAQIRALRDRVRLDAGEPDQVRSAAACVPIPG
jgi:hypothetical protein